MAPEVEERSNICHRHTHMTHQFLVLEMETQLFTVLGENVSFTGKETKIKNQQQVVSLEFATQTPCLR